MNYTEQLNNCIKKSGLKNVEILEKLNEKGISITKNYLSVLRHDNSKIPSDDISSALEDICGVEKNLLVVQGQLDRLNGPIKDYVNSTLQMYRDFGVIYKGMLTIEQQKYIDEKITSDSHIICEIINHSTEYRMLVNMIGEFSEGKYQRYAIVPLGSGEITYANAKEINDLLKKED